jgi:tetratricopeptide (TPR) repeat protein
MKTQNDSLGHLSCSSLPRCTWWLALVLTICSTASGQSSFLKDCTRAFYRGQYAKAADLAEKHLHMFPNDAPVRVMLGRAALALGNFPKAIDAFQNALASDPKNIDALYYLSLVSRESSRREYERLFSIAPDSHRVHQLLGEAALAANNMSEAEEEFQKALKANPRSIEISSELAELKRSQSKFDEAIVFYERAEQIGPLNYEIAYGLGACYTYKQDYSQAIDWLRKAVALAADSAAGHFALGNALFQYGDSSAAIPELNVSLRLEPRMKQAYFLLARAYSKLGRPEDAKAALKKLDDLNRSEMPGQDTNSTGEANPKPDKP